VNHEHDHSEINDESIVRYLSGEAGPEEAMHLLEALSDPLIKQRFDSVQSMWHAAHPAKTPRKVDTAANWNLLHNKLGKNINQRTLQFNQNLVRYGVAAAVTFALVATYFTYTLLKKPEFVNVATTKATQKIVLDDNSNITLNQNTSLSYPEKFTSEVREVNLYKGEAYFSIAHDQKKPFIIRTTFGNIRVVGTAFNVILHKKVLEIGVDEGKVLVYTDQDSVLVGTGSFASVTPATSAIFVSHFENGNSWAYATQKFKFEDELISDVIDDIQKAQPFRIRLQNEHIKNCKVTASFDNVSVEKMLNLIAESLNLTVIRNGKEFILEGQGCP
jgi:transmembrane sensor